MIDFEIELHDKIIPLPYCPFCDYEMNYMGDVSEPTDLRECQREHNPSIPRVFLNYSRFNCPKCGFDARFRQQELHQFIATQRALPRSVRK